VKRQQMERLLRDELEKWDNDADAPGKASAPGSATVCFASVTPPALAQWIHAVDGTFVTSTLDC